MTRLIALVTPHTYSHRTAEETIALGYLTSILRRSGYKVALVDGWLRGIGPIEIIKKICQSGRPDLIGMSCYRSNLAQAKELLALVHQCMGAIPSICGGYGPTFHDSDFIEAGFDVAVRGEAEHIIVPLVNALLCGLDLSNIPGITYCKNNSLIRTNGINPAIDLDSLPFPTRDEIESVKRRKNPAHVCTARGCNARCLFCSISAFTSAAQIAKRWRHRSIRNIVEELSYLYENFGITNFKFVDDSFLEPPRDEKWAAEFADAIIKANLPIRFRTQVRADRLNESIVENLKRAGWFSTSIGIESAALSALRRMRKVAKPEDNIRALNLLRQFGIYTQIGMILFDYGTTIKELEENCHFLEENDWVITKGIFTEMYAAKGTLYTKRLADLNILKTDFVQQNFYYEVLDPNARRVYRILKNWHKSHAPIYDWAIDSITAPKILPEEGYAEVYRLCKKLTYCDIKFFRSALNHVKNSTDSDDEMVCEAIAGHIQFYLDAQSTIQLIYDKYGLVYDGVLNPFLT